MRRKNLTGVSSTGLRLLLETPVRFFLLMEEVAQPACVLFGGEPAGRFWPALRAPPRTVPRQSLCSCVVSIGLGSAKRLSIKAKHVLQLQVGAEVCSVWRGKTVAPERELAVHLANTSAHATARCAPPFFVRLCSVHWPWICSR